MDIARVVEIASEGSYGTGYLIGPGVVLTARHILMSARRHSPKLGDRCSVRAVGVDRSNRPAWQSAKLVWMGEGEKDLAVLDMDARDLAHKTPPFGELPSAAVEITCRTVGFPLATGKTRAGEDTYQLDGTLRTGTYRFSGEVSIDVESKPPKDPKEWRGVSGAAVFAGDYLIAVIKSYPSEFDGEQLKATPVAAVADDPDFCKVLGLDCPLKPSNVRHLRRVTLFKDRLRPVLLRHSLFGGRVKERRQLDNFLTKTVNGCVFVTGQAGCGKSALLANWVKHLASSERHVCYHFISRLDGWADKDFALRNLCEQLLACHDRHLPLPENVNELWRLYLELVETPEPTGKGLVLVLDGLDEALDWQANILLPRSLPDGTHIVLSAGEVAGVDWLASLKPVTYEFEVLRLGPLALHDIASLMRVAGGKASQWSGSGQALEIVQNVSNGDPFYLQFLMKDILDGTIASIEELRRQPHGLTGYLDKWWQDASAATSEPAVRDLLGYLIVAKGRLSRTDLVGINKEDALSGLAFEGTLSRVQRYVVGDRSSGYTLCQERFREYLEERVVDLEERKRYLGLLLDYCSRWKEDRNASAYVLRHYPGHLLESKRWTQLLDLARDPDFADAQRLTLPNEPSLPINTVQMALKATVEIDAIGSTAEFCLLHARRLAHSRSRETPLEALRSGSHEKALELADLQEKELSSLWHLVLVWELIDEGRPGDADVTLAHLIESGMLPLSGWDCGDFLYLFVCIYEVNPEHFSRIVREILEYNYQWELCELLIAHDQVEAALSVAKVMDDPWALADAVGRLAMRSPDGLSQLSRTASGIDDPGAAAWGLAMIAMAEAEYDDLEAAHRSLQHAYDRLSKTDDRDTLAKVSGVMASGWASLGDKQKAKALYDCAQTTAWAIGDEPTRNKALAEIAPVPARYGDLDSAREAAREVPDTAMKATAMSNIANSMSGNLAFTRSLLKEALGQARDADQEQRDELISKIVLAMAETGDFGVALNTAAELQEPWFKADVQAEIAVLQARRGDYDAALRTTQGIEIEWSQAKAEKDVAITRARAGELTAALKIANGIRVAPQQVKALSGIAIEQSIAGKADVAHETLQHALKATSAFVEDAKASFEAGEFEATFVVEECWDVAVAQSQVSGIEQALITCSMIPDDGQRAKVYAKIAKTLAESGQSLEARTCYSLALNTTSEYKQRWERIQASRSQAEALAAIAEIQAKSGDFPAALETAQRIEDGFTGVEALTSIATFQAEQSASEDFRTTIDEAIKLANSLNTDWLFYKKSGSLWRTTGLSRVTTYPTLRSRADALMIIGDALANAGRTGDARTCFADAIKFASQIRSPNDQANSLGRIALAQAQSGCFSEALETARSIDGRTLMGQKARANAFGEVAATQHDAGRNRESLATIAAMLETAAEADATNKDVWLDAVSNTRSQMGDFAGAFDIAMQIKGPLERDAQLRNIAEAQAQSGDFDCAMKTAQAIKESDVYTEAVGSIAMAQLEAGKIDTAIETIETIEAVADSFESLNTLLEIIVAQAKAGRIVDAEASAAYYHAILVDQFVDNDDEERQSSLVDLASAWARAGVYQAAFESAQEIKDASFRSEALTSIATAQANAGLGGAAVKTSEAILADRDENLPLIADALANREDRENLKLLLAQLSEYETSAHRTVGHLASLYPEQAGAVAKAVVSSLE